MVGSPPKEFKVHSGVLSKSVVLVSQYQALPASDHLSLPSVDPSVFESALCYMYSGEHCEYFSPSHPVPKKAAAKAAAFQQDCMLYCFARNYQLERLVTLTIKKIKSLGRIGYHSVFSAAKEAYKQLPGDESWFRDCFKQETKKALRDVRDLAHEPWLLDAFREDNGSFILDLFTAMTEGYETIISKGIARGHRSASATKILRWFSPNLNPDANDFSAGSSSVDWAEDRSTSNRDETADETEGDETTSVAGSFCVEGLTPSGDSGCVVEAFPEVAPAEPIEVAEEADAPQEEVAVPVPEESFDLDVPWVPESFGNSKKATKNRKSQHHFLCEDAPTEEPVPEPAFPEEEVLFAEEPPVAVEEAVLDEEPPMAVEEAVFAEEPPMIVEEAVCAEEPPMAVEDAVFDEPWPEPEPVERVVFGEEQLVPIDEAPIDILVTCEEEPAAPAEEIASTAPEPELVSAAEEAPADLRPEPLWGFSTKKSKKRAKKKTWLTPADPPSPPSFAAAPDAAIEPEIPDTDKHPVCQDEAPAPAPAPDDASTSGFRYASLPVFKSATFGEELLPDDKPCTSRGFHLARDSRWMACQKCRGEVSVLAQKMARDCNSGWIFT